MTHSQTTMTSMAHWSERIGRRIKLRDLHILLAVAKEGSMGRASTALGISQPVISKAIADLERTLGVELFDRSARGVEPTMFGRELLQCSTAVFDDLRRGVEGLQFLSGHSSGDLRIGCTEVSATGFAPQVIDRLAREHPRLRFHVETADPATLINRHLRERSIELAIASAVVADPEIDVDPLFHDRHVVMAGIAHPRARKRNLSLADLADERWILPPPASLPGLLAAEAFRSAGVPIPPAQVISYSAALSHQLLATGRYVAFVPMAIMRVAKHLPLRRLDVRFEGIPRVLSIVTLRNRSLSPLARLFIERAHAVAKMHEVPSSAAVAKPRPRRGA